MNRDEELRRKLRSAQFIKNNGRVLRTINILRHQYERLDDISLALSDMPEERYMDCINFLTEAGYIKLRNVTSKQAIAGIEDCDYKMLEAKLTEKGIRLLSGSITDEMVDV